MRINDILVEFAASGGGDSGNYFQALASAWYNGTFDTGSLQKGIKSQQDVERLLNRGIVCPDGVTRKLHIDYNSDFDGVEIYSDDYYEYGDHDDTIDSRTGQKWGPYDFMAFSDEDLSEGINEFVTPQAVAQDPGLEREKDVDVIFFGKMPRDYAAETAWAALEEVLPAEYPAGSEKAQEKVKEVAFQGGAVVTTKPLSVAKKLVATFNGYGIKSRINGNLNEFAADDGNDGGEDDALRNYARMWWAGDEATQMQIERALAKMGWEIGEDEGGYDNGGVFVVRAGDENGNSYQSWPAEDLTEGVAEGHADQERKIFKKNGKPVGEVGIDRESSPGNGQWYMTCYGVVSYGGYDSYEEAVAELKHCLKQGVAEGNRKSEPPEADYGADYQDMVSRVKKLAGLGPLKTVYDPQKRVYKNVPTAVQPKK
jgi:hypothetical protein